MAVVLVDIVHRDMDYSDICFDDFYKGERANELRLSKHYQVVLDLVRSMIKNHDKRIADEAATRRREGSEVRQESGR